MKVLITRYNKNCNMELPNILWISGLAPSEELLSNFLEKEITTEEFNDFYVEEKTTSFNTVKTLVKLHQRLIKGKEICFIGDEPQPEYCHRHALSDLIQTLPTRLPFKVVCPFLTQNDPKDRCLLKLKVNRYIKVPTRSGKEELTIRLRSVGFYDMCDFIKRGKEDVSGEVLRECEIFKKKTKMFTCKTCLLFNWMCLKTGERIFPVNTCNYYIEQYLRFGDVGFVKDAMSRYTLQEIRSKLISYWTKM